MLSGLTAYLFLDAVQSSDTGKRLGCCWRCMGHVDVMELAPRVSLTGDFANLAVPVEMVKAGVCVGLQRTLEIFQMPLGMFALAIFRVSEPHGWCG